jgi:two-component system, LytTR family, sensor kinase
VLNLTLEYGQGIKPRYKQYILLIFCTHIVETFSAVLFYNKIHLIDFFERLVYIHPDFLLFQTHIFWAVSIVYYLQTREQTRTRKITEQEYQLLLLQELKTKAELETLQAKVSPHFLYNALNSIAGLIHIDADKAEKMVLLLAKFFRYSTRLHQGYRNAVAHELEMVQTYLEVEMVRFEDRLAYTITVEDEALYQHQIPSFLLQPLVENAIKHGISKLAQKGILHIRIYLENEYLCLQICDNGAPFPANLSMGYGLQSTQDKIKLLGGEGAEMSIMNEPEKCILIRLRKV